MKEIRFRDDWIFWVDEEKTRDFYGKTTSLAPSKLKERLPEVAAFLEQMGIDVQKPLNPKDMDSFDDLLYFAYGRAETTTGFELDFYDKEILLASVVVYDDLINVEHYMWEMPEPHADILLLEIFVNILDDGERT